MIENKIGWGGVTEERAASSDQSAWLSGQVRGETMLGEVEAVSRGLFDLVERDLVSGAEGLLISDFFDLVEEHFPLIGPYSTLARCGDNRFRVERRLDTILGEVVGTDVGKAKRERYLPGNAKIAQAWLEFSSDNSAVCLNMYLGDTLTQSRALYGDRSALDAVLALRSVNWCVEPNFHWGFMATGYAWANTPLEVEKYCDYWVHEIGATRELSRPECETYWVKLESAKIVEADGKKAFDAHFTGSKRLKVHPRPGLFCQYRWKLADAQSSDVAGKFVEKVECASTRC